MDEIGQKKSGISPLLLIIILAVVAIGGYFIFAKKETSPAGDAPVAEMPAETDTSAPTVDENGVVTETKKLEIDRPTSQFDVPVGYTSTDPKVVEMMSARTLGDANAPVKIIEYASLTCGHCGAFHRDTLPAFKTQFVDTGRVQVTYKEFPLNEPAVNASMLLRCAPSDQYFNFMGKLFAEQEKWAYTPDYLPMIKDMAKEFGLDDASIEACLANDELKKSIIGDMKAAAEKFKVQSTPSFVFNNGERVLVGHQPLTMFETTIQKAEKGELGKEKEAAPVEAAPVASPAAQ